MKGPKATSIAHKKIDSEYSFCFLISFLLFSFRSTASDFAFAFMLVFRRMVKKRKADASAKKEKTSKKNSGAPKRSSSAFFVFIASWFIHLKLSECVPLEQSVLTHELDAIKSTPQMLVSYESRPHTQTVPVSIDCGVSTRRLQPRRMSSYRTRTADNMSNADCRRTSRGERTTKKGFGIVEIVDLKCGNADKSWSRPITDQFKKLSFSRLSD
ncbi:hypothetical protein LOK49_LG07G02515 [Camellia lanceoleosa]|uniref:Uncharacterized protein n=1 Tax=Camellia lanceoleosa TaxID=1840588 RepID=A0ACC0H2P7_9ERIC|nr:hypothetical protein LOK49_LG07G02515 [Camellia lanceoleosa]